MLISSPSAKILLSLEQSEVLLLHGDPTCWPLHVGDSWTAAKQLHVTSWPSCYSTMLSWMLWSYHQTQQWRNPCCSLAPDIPVWPNSAKWSVKYYQLAWNSSGQAGADWSAVNGVKPLISRHNQHCKCCLMVIAAIMTVTFVLSVAVFICFSNLFTTEFALTSMRNHVEL